MKKFYFLKVGFWNRRLCWPCSMLHWPGWQAWPKQLLYVFTGSWALNTVEVLWVVLIWNIYHWNSARLHAVPDLHIIFSFCLAWSFPMQSIKKPIFGQFTWRFVAQIILKSSLMGMRTSKDACTEMTSRPLTNIVEINPDKLHDEKTNLPKTHL